MAQSKSLFVAIINADKLKGSDLKVATSGFYPDLASIFTLVTTMRLAAHR